MTHKNEQPMNSERELFELWCTKDDEFCIHRYAGSDDYSDDYTQCAWMAWQASTRRQGYKLVPVEPTEKMIRAVVEEVKKTGHLVCFYKAMIGAVSDD